MDVIRLGRIELWYNSFFRISVAIPILMALLFCGRYIPLRHLIVYTAIVILNYYYTSIINYYTDIREDAYKYKLEKRWNVVMDPANPFVELSGEDVNAIRKVIYESVVGYALLTAIMTIYMYYYIDGWPILLMHHGILFLVANIYSLRPRLKESIFGVLIASMLYWYPPVIVMTHLELYEYLYVLYVALIIVLGIGESIKHTLDHYSIDLLAKRRTFAIIVGVKRSKKIYKALMITFHLLLLPLSFYIHPLLLILALFCLYGYITVEEKVWVSYMIALYLYLITIIVLYHRELWYSTMACALILGLPIFSSINKYREYLSREVYLPLKGVCIDMYYRTLRILHRMVKSHEGRT